MARRKRSRHQQPAPAGAHTHQPKRAEAKPSPQPRPRPKRKPVRRTPAWVAPVATVGGLAVLVVAFLAIRYFTTPAPQPAPNVDTTAAVVSTLTTIPQSELDKVGLGSANNVLARVSAAPLTGAGGKPVVFYYGAEFCPYCAAERWPLIIALSRFGTLTGLQTTTSSSSDVFANTPTFTFRAATYSSIYIEFQGVEATDRDHRPVQSPTAAQNAVLNKLDPSGGIPFIDLGNRFVIPSASYQPDVLSGMSWQQIANALSNPESSQARAILGSANLITAGICALTGNQPATACTAAVQTLEPK